MACVSLRIRAIRKGEYTKRSSIERPSRKPVHPGDKKARNEERKKNLSRGIRLCILFLFPQRRLSNVEGKGWHVSRRGERRVKHAFRLPVSNGGNKRSSFEKRKSSWITKYKNWFLSSRRKGKERKLWEKWREGAKGNVIDGKIYMKYWIGTGVSYFLSKRIQLTRESRCSPLKRHIL